MRFSLRNTCRRRDPSRLFDCAHETTFNESVFCSSCDCDSDIPISDGCGRTPMKFSRFVVSEKAEQHIIYRGEERRCSRQCDAIRRRQPLAILCSHDFKPTLHRNDFVFFFKTSNLLDANCEIYVVDKYEHTTPTKRETGWTRKDTNQGVFVTTTRCDNASRCRPSSVEN